MHAWLHNKISATRQLVHKLGQLTSMLVNWPRHPTTTQTRDRHPTTTDGHPTTTDIHPTTRDRHPTTTYRHPTTTDRHPTTT